MLVNIICMISFLQICWDLFYVPILAIFVNDVLKENVYSFFFFFLGLLLQHMQVPKLGIKSELQLLAYARATAMQDWSHICNLNHSSQQCCITGLLSETRDITHILTDTSQIHFHCTTMATPGICLSLFDLLHLVWGSLVASMLLHMPFFHSFLWLSNIVYKCHIFFLHPSVDGH